MAGMAHSVTFVYGPQEAVGHLAHPDTTAVLVLRDVDALQIVLEEGSGFIDLLGAHELVLLDDGPTDFRALAQHLQ